MNTEPRIGEARLLLRSPPWMTSQMLPALMTIALAAHATIAVIAWLSPDGHTGDFQRYWQLAGLPGRAYRDFSVEYPPGALIVFGALADLVGGASAFNSTMIGLNVIADVTIVATLLVTFGLEASTWYAVVSIPLLSLLYFRMDLWPTAAVTLAVTAWIRGRRWQGAAALVLGAALKLWPLPFGALFLVDTGRSQADNRRALWFLVAAMTGLVLAWVGYAGVRGPLQVLTFRGATGWEVEGTIGSVVRLFDASTLRVESGSIRVGSVHRAMPVLLFLIAAPPSLWAIWRGGKVNLIGTGWVASVGALLSCSALLSPQFIGWLIPGAAIAWTEGDRRTGCLIVLVVVLTVAYRLFYTTPQVVTARNVVLLVTVVQALATLARTRPAGERSPA